MIRILTFFWQLCLLRESPARFPSSPFAAGTVFLIYLAIALVATSLIRVNHGAASVMGMVFVGLMLQASLVLALLAFKGLTARFARTFASLLGAQTIMMLILLPVNLLMGSEEETLKQFADAVSWVCLGWWLAIGGFILHKSTDISIVQGSVLVFTMELLSAIAVTTLFPVAAG